MLLLIFLIYLSTEMVSEADKIRYISTEHPNVTYINPKYASFVNFTSRRYGRNDPFYYVSLHFNSLKTWDNNVTLLFYFFEWQSYNVYKPAFLEMRFKFCDLIDKDKFFGSALRREIGHSCPVLPGEYHLCNMTIPVTNIPRSFPIKKGRIYCNMSVTDTHELVGSGYIDMEIKEYNTRGKKNK